MAGVLGRPGGLVLHGFFARTPNDQVVGRASARDVQLFNQRMFTGRRTNRAIALDDTQRVPVDQRLQRAFKERRQVVVHRVHLEQHNLVLDEDFLEGIQRRNGRDVARTKDQRDLALPLGDRHVVSRCSVLREVALGHTVLHPDLRRDARQQQVIPKTVRHD